MGIATATGLVLLIILGGGALTVAVERVLAGPEMGPAQDVMVTWAEALPNADRWLAPAGPVTALVGVLLGAVVLPFGPALIPADLEIGVFFFIVVVDFVVLGVALAGWGANTPDGIEACYRIVAQLVSYIIPLGLAYVGAIMMARSLSTERIIAAQANMWFVVLQPIGFVLYVIAGLMQSYRRPFMEPFADSIGGGVLGDAGGWAALVWRTVLAALLFLVAAMGAVLFLGGWSGPILPAPVWMTIKTVAMMALMIGAGRLVRPLSTAQMLALAWRILIPIGLVNVLVVGILILLHVGPA